MSFSRLGNSSFWRAAATLTVACLSLAACSDRPTRADVQAVARHVERVERDSEGATLALAGDLTVVESRVGTLEEESGDVAQAMAQMGDGFNVLAEAVEEAHAESRDVARRQTRLERHVSARLDSPLGRARQAQADDAMPWVLVGRGRDLRGGTALVDLRLTLSTPAQLVRAADGERPTVTYAVRDVGRRLYGSAPAEALCLDVVQGDLAEGAFTAADCAQPFHVYDFLREE